MFISLVYSLPAESIRNSMGLKLRVARGYQGLPAPGGLLCSCSPLGGGASTLFALRLKGWGKPRSAFSPLSSSNRSLVEVSGTRTGPPNDANGVTEHAPHCHPQGRSGTQECPGTLIQL